jgi:hypothetical protein
MKDPRYSLIVALDPAQITPKRSIMPMTNVLPASIFIDAERELAAFLSAVTTVIGFNALSRASELWLQVMKSSECPANESFEKFFRSVTIRATALLEETTRAARELESLDLRVSVTARILRGVSKVPQINPRYSTNNELTFHDKERA